MLHKTALLVASLAASLTLTIALALAGFAPGTSTAPAATAATTAADTADLAAPPVQVDKVYVAPPGPQQTVTVHKVVASGGGENESEGGD
jgi:hypothetical protein